MEAGKTALVTGALGVLGRAIVTALLEDGFRTVLVDLDQKKLDEYSRSLPLGSSLPVACDISAPAAVDAAVKQIRDNWGSVDVLVNNAGILSNNKAVQTALSICPAPSWKT
jgi:3-oxoacyl-[acyl-carrier protein] reductase